MTDEIYMTAIDGLYRTYEETVAKAGDGWTAYSKISHAYQHFTDAVFDDLVRQDEADREKQEQEIDDEQIVPVSVDPLIEEYESLRKRVRKLTKENLQTWFFARDWIDHKLRPEDLSMRRQFLDDAPMSEIQFCLLQVLGIRRLEDLSRWEAQTIIDRIRGQKNCDPKIDKQQ